MGLRICVCVKPVPRSAVQLQLDPETGVLIRSGANGLNAADEYAVEEALQLSDGSDNEVVLVSMAPTGASDALRTGLAMGAHRAVVLSDVALHGSDLIATSRALANVLERESPDLVLFGAMSSDSGGALLWAAVAERLKMPLLSRASTLKLDDGLVRASRQTENGVHTAEAPCPCVVALAGPVNSPRYPTFKNIIAAKRQPIDVLTASDAGLRPEECGSAGSGTNVLRVYRPPAPTRAENRILEGPQATEELFTILAEKGLL